ncbi:hypothetical protein [Pseudomonas orientalis]|uniref:hypothetical protein n=1 Tax=Pseudomonas orientalis TaxID=76758 RepID=UPI002FDF6847
MIDFKLFRPLYSTKISQSLGHSLCDFKSWIAQGRYQVSSILPNGDITLYILDHDSLNETLGYDLARFTCAAFESMLDINEDIQFPKATAWPGIKTYYASFFSAHALLRLFGVSCSQIESTQAALLSKYAKIYGVTCNAQAGFYVANFSPSTNSLTLKKMKDTHGDTWKSFNNQLIALSNEVLQVPGIAQNKSDTSAFLLKLSDSLCGSGRMPEGNWPSSYRNNLNYKQDYQAWYPYHKTSIKIKNIRNYLTKWASVEFNPNLGLLESDERLRFFGTCSAILHLLANLSTEISSTAKKGSIHKTRTSKLLSLTSKP